MAGVRGSWFDSGTTSDSINSDGTYDRGGEHYCNLISGYFLYCDKCGNVNPKSNEDGTLATVSYCIFIVIFAVLLVSVIGMICFPILALAFYFIKEYTERPTSPLLYTCPQCGYVFAINKFDLEQYPIRNPRRYTEEELEKQQATRLGLHWENIE